MLGLILGILTVLLGAKAFTANGLPLTREKNLQGMPAKVVGSVCVLLGVIFIVDGALASFGVVRLLTGG